MTYLADTSTVARLREHLRALFAWHPMPGSAWRFVQHAQDDFDTIARVAGIRVCRADRPHR